MPRPFFRQKRRTRRKLRASAVILCAVAGVSGLTDHRATAGTIRDDVPDSSYTALAASPTFAAAGSILSQIPEGLYGGSGVLVADRWVLTAGHMLKVQLTTFGAIEDPSTITYGNNGNYTAGEWFTYPGFDNNNLTAGIDIGLIHLTSSVSGVTPATRYTLTSEAGQTGTIVGFGFTGNGLTGEQNGTYGTRRAGNNIVDQVGTVLGIDFDQPGNTSKSSMGANTPVPLEYLAANGDSGGPLYISDGGVQKVAGLVSYGGSPIDGFFNASYGDTAFFTRVSSFNAWIDDQLSARYWNNASGGAFSTGANWIEGSAPDSTNIAVFNLAGTYSVTLGSSITNKRVRVRAGNVTMNLSGATYTLGSSTLENSLTVGKTASDNASLTISNGTISVVNVGIGESSPAIGSLIIDGAGALAASSTIAVGGTPNATGGTGTLQINSTGLAQINGGMHVYSAGRVINNGSIAWTGGAIQMNSGAILNNNSGAILDVQGNLSLSTLGGSPSLINAGTIRKSAGAGLSAVSVPFTNTGTIQVQSGSMSFIGAGTNNGGTLLTSATTRIDFNGTNSVTFSNASTITGSGVVGFGSLVSNTGTLKIDTTALLIASGTLNNSGTVDLNGKLILDYTGSSPISTIKSQIATGFASGAWTGSGIKSTSAAANASSLHKTAIGYADASSVPLSSFGGQSVDPTSLLLRYTAYGDANLDGTVNTSDFTMLGQNFNKSSTFWNFGDFNYDGTVNALDFNAMASNFGFVLPSDPLDLGAPSLGALVPEPTSLALGAALVFGIRRRRLR